MNQPPNDLHGIPDSVEHTRSIADVCELIGCESQDWLIDRVRNGTFPGRACRDCQSFPLLSGKAARRSFSAEHPPITTRLDNEMQYVLNVSLTFGYRGDAEQAEKDLATTVFNGLVNSWCEVEEVRW